MKSVIIGAGTYGEVYLAYLKEAGVDVVGFLDDDEKYHNSSVRGVPILGGVMGGLQTVCKDYDIEAVYCPLGNNRLRVKFLERARSLGYITPNFIHPTVIIAPDVKMADEGVYVLQATQIMPFVTIERDVMISAGANIIHHSHLCQGTFISNGVCFGANILAKKYAYVGMGSTIMTGVKTIGEDCLIGAGAVVIKDVPDNAVVAGVPAKVIKYNKKEMQ